MASRHYAQILDASDPDQSADDDFRLGQSPPEILRGSFRIGYLPRDDSSYASTRYLLSVQTLADHLAFALEPTEASEAIVTVRLDGDLCAATDPFTFDANQELTFTFNAPDATITVAGATTGNGESEPGVVWNVPGIGLRLGGNVVGADLARGAVSLPYAVPGAPLPDPVILLPSMLDFEDEDNSGLIVLL